MSFRLHCIVVAVAGVNPPVVEPNFKIFISRGSIPFLLGEVGVSDKLNYTKLKSKLWIEICGGLYVFETTELIFRYDMLSLLKYN